MHRRLYTWLGWTDQDIAFAALPLYLLMTVAYAILYAWLLTTHPALHRLDRLLPFSVLLLAHTALHWLSMRLVSSPRQTQRGAVAYSLLQGGMVFAISFLAQEPGFAIGLYVALLAEFASLLWPDHRAIALSSAFFVVLFALNATLAWGFHGFVRSLPLAGAIFAGVMVFVVLFVRQVKALEHSRALLQELQLAHRQLQDYAEQVESLTIGQERQRMARELHDTLAQGLAGLILQLEAADGHLESGQSAAARATVQHATRQARQTLHEARRAVQALRTSALEQASLVKALATEIERFETVSAVPTTLEVEGDPVWLSSEVSQDLLRIVQESLSNIGRHAQARHASVRLVAHAGELALTIQDDGCGFDLEDAMLQPGHFGLEGMAERAQRIGATLRIETAPQHGTRVVLRLAAAPDAGISAPPGHLPPLPPEEDRTP